MKCLVEWDGSLICSVAENGVGIGMVWVRMEWVRMAWYRMVWVYKERLQKKRKKKKSTRNCLCCLFKF